MRLWVDDLREPPAHDWIWAQTSAAAIWYLNNFAQHSPLLELADISLDHDLGTTSDGDQDDTRRVVHWLIENEAWDWIAYIGCHSANPVGREWIEGMIERYLR